MKTEEECVPVIWPPTPEEKWAATLDPDQARVVRPSDTEPGKDPNTPTPPKSTGLDLSAYYWRGPEAGVRAGGLDGRWYISLQDSGSRPNERIRPLPLVLDACPEKEINPELKTTSIEAVIRISGSFLNGVAAGTPSLIESIRAARSKNPHWAVGCMGHMNVGDTIVTIGCTVPEISVSSDGISSAYLSQAADLRTAGVAELEWIFRKTGEFLPAEFWSQVDWTLTPEAEEVGGSWWFWPVNYRFPEPDSVNPDGTPSPIYRAYINNVRRVVERFRQPGSATSEATPTNDSGIASLPDRLRAFIVYTNEIRNSINRDSNIIRGLHGINQQPKVCIESFRTSVSLPGITAGGNPSEIIDIDGGSPIELYKFCETTPPLAGLYDYALAFTGGGGAGGATPTGGSGTN